MLQSKQMLQAPIPLEIPRHVALIMDGNRRWARAHRLPVVEGYRRGVTALRAAVRGALATGVERITVYGFSTENWGRSPHEVELIMSLCAACAQSEKPGLSKQGVRVEVIGDLDAFAFPARAAVRDLVRATQHNSRLTLTLALNYSGRAEIVRAVQAIARNVAAGTLAPDDIDEQLLSAHMYAPHAPDPDLLIRTGGDFRVSNFLLYQLAYTELLTLPLMWPDFTEEHFAEAIAEFTQRQRRFGG
ncbi:MAG TPA: polyprenyl diphosphate synthase [Candidatus Dormibacteraeota bacterium]|nr:polyprenyl diphosphate synthase [Candidatus Dormibacteraeota bacterium]